MLGVVALAEVTAIGAGEQPATAASKDALFQLMKPGTDVIQSRVSTSLAGQFAIVLRSDEFASLRDDADLGPFIASAVKHTNDAIVIVVPSSASDTTHAVFFKAKVPVAHSLRPGGTPVAEALTRIEEARQAVKTPVADGAEELYFQEAKLHADNGTPVPSYRILSAGPRRQPA